MRFSSEYPSASVHIPRRPAHLGLWSAKPSPFPFVSPPLLPPPSSPPRGGTIPKRKTARGHVPTGLVVPRSAGTLQGQRVDKHEGGDRPREKLPVDRFHTPCNPSPPADDTTTTLTKTTTISSPNRLDSSPVQLPFPVWTPEQPKVDSHPDTIAAIFGSCSRTASRRIKNANKNSAAAELSMTTGSSKTLDEQHDHPRRWKLETGAPTTILEELDQERRRRDNSSTVECRDSQPGRDSSCKTHQNMEQQIRVSQTGLVHQRIKVCTD